MSVVNSIFIAMLAGAAVLNWRYRRGMFWVGLIALNYALSCIYWRLHLNLGWPPPALSLFSPEFVVACLDAAICFAIFKWGDYEWEMWLWRLFQASFLAGILFLANNVLGLGMISHLAYSYVMEIIMASSIIMVAGVGSWQLDGRTHARAFYPWPHLHRSFIPLHRKAGSDQD